MSANDPKRAKADNPMCATATIVMLIVSATLIALLHLFSGAGKFGARQLATKKWISTVEVEIARDVNTT